MYKVVTLDRETNRENLSVVPAYLAGAEDLFPHEAGGGVSTICFREGIQTISM